MDSLSISDLHTLPSPPKLKHLCKNIYNIIVHVHVNNIFLQFTESQFEIRSDEKHLEYCDLLEQDGLSTADHQHYSLVYGVNRRALLSSLRYFSVASGSLLPDIMHDVLEGALPFEVKLMLKVNIVE